MQTACREYTHSRNLTTSRPRGWIRRSAQPWMWNSFLTMDVIALISWSNHCLETEQFHGFALWMVSTKRSQKRWRKCALKTLICSSAQGNLWQRLSQDRNLLWIGLPIQFLQWKKMDRHWYTTIRSQLFWSVKTHDQNTCDTKCQFPRQIDGAVNFDDLIEKLKVKFADTLQWTVSLGELSGERRSGFNAAWTSFVRWNPVLPSNSGTWRI